MRVSITRDGDPVGVADVENTDVIPVMIFELTEHYGSGEYRVIDAATGVPMFGMTVGWFEGDDDGVGHPC
jgi:hypothetical protein